MGTQRKDGATEDVRTTERRRDATARFHERMARALRAAGRDADADAAQRAAETARADR